MNSQQKPKKRILIVTAVSVEKEAVLRGLNGAAGFTVIAAGVGPIAAAAGTARALAEGEYDFVISAGIGGGFTGLAEPGSIVVADEIIAADLGVETPEGFSSLDKLGFGSTRFLINESIVNPFTKAMLKTGLPFRSGPILTVSTVTGSSGTASVLAARVPGAMIEAMEGFGVATAAHDRGLPFIEIRSVSNLVGPRDKSLWRIEEALSALEAVSSKLWEVRI